METKIAQKRLDDLSAVMTAKGLREPSATLRLCSDEESYVHLRWKTGIDRGGAFGNDEYQSFKGDIAEAFGKASAFIADLPDAQQAKLNDFMAALGSVIDIGNTYGIEADYLNPLVASMKKLSENAITYQKAA